MSPIRHLGRASGSKLKFPGWCGLCAQPLQGLDRVREADLLERAPPTLLYPGHPGLPEASLPAAASPACKRGLKRHTLPSGWSVWKTLCL